MSNWINIIWRKYILGNISKLKGAGKGIKEDLISYKMAQEKLNRKSVFTRNGNLIAKVNNKIQKIDNIVDIDNMCESLE